MLCTSRPQHGNLRIEKGGDIKNQLLISSLANPLFAKKVLNDGAAFLGL
jgi:hypothetical protein